MPTRTQLDTEVSFWTHARFRTRLFRHSFTDHLLSTLYQTLCSASVTEMKEKTFFQIACVRCWMVCKGCCGKEEKGGKTLPGRGKWAGKGLLSESWSIGRSSLEQGRGKWNSPLTKAQSETSMSYTGNQTECIVQQNEKQGPPEGKRRKELKKNWLKYSFRQSALQENCQEGISRGALWAARSVRFPLVGPPPDPK